ncbi:tripartite tricarboxylate transporter substrate binding protein [Alginatibacterium sediminis]|uniref:Tripartite tricarboxylate transporter substrate binding protein n=1 Tax=Alginatibacterium sediminis TaxID=2164068 RepID=A0A420ED04_9ALTE|nr:tripartite tricarboxylate transporter substrate-binding protein [Alginatibacterium sediminis]RKF18534.1 tripartite tricarboxylate transporter substrate binding protein [Alginatibacterium sediminis]
MFKAHKLIKALVTTGLVVASLSSTSFAQEVHFLIPGGAGGGWDGTARGTGEALMKSGKVEKASFQNMSGGGGGKAIAHLIETAKTQEDTLMVNSTPIVVRSLTGVFPQSFRDLTPVAATIADYGALIVRSDSKYTHWEQVVADFKADSNSVKVAGGSARGSLDHLVAAAAIKNEGLDPMKLRYVAYDAGGKAMAGLLSGETALLSTGLGEALEMSKSEQVRILAITAEERVSDAPDVPTLKEMGNDTVFANWRGFFAAPGISDEKRDEFSALLESMYDTPEWEVVRARNGWVNNFVPADQFYSFLENQEKVVGELMKELGFL